MSRRNVHDLVADARAEIEEVSVAELRAELAAGNAVVVDIRDFRERIEKGAIPGSINAPRGMLEFWFDPDSPYHQDRFTLDGRYVLHCASGWRSALAAAALQELGATNVAHLRDGFTDWVDSGGEVEDVAATSSWIRRPR